MVGLVDEDGSFGVGVVSDGIIYVGRLSRMGVLVFDWFRGSEVTAGLTSSSPDWASPFANLDIGGERVREDEVPSSRMGGRVDASSTPGELLGTSAKPASTPLSASFSTSTAIFKTISSSSRRAT